MEVVDLVAADKAVDSTEAQPAADSLETQPMADSEVAEAAEDSVEVVEPDSIRARAASTATIAEVVPQAEATTTTLVVDSVVVVAAAEMLRQPTTVGEPAVVAAGEGRLPQVANRDDCF